MRLVRGWWWLAVVVAWIGLPGARASSDSVVLEREPASKVASSKSSPAKKKKKKSAKKAAKPKSHSKSKAKASSTRKKNKGESSRSHYPTQPGGSGFGDVPNEKKEDLPPAQNPEANP